jgi:succinoglycan biosynthesis protein ExoA
MEPLVTVILPIRNEEAFIEKCLGAVLQQDYPVERMEILIADGMSDDRTLEVIRAMPGAERVRVLPNPGRIQSAGLNVAIREARGDIVVRVDGHTIIASDYVRKCVDTLRLTGAQNVGGAMDPVGITPMGRAIALAGKSAFAVPTAFHVSKQAQVTDTVYLGAWPREVLDQVGVFREDVGVNEDYELNYRIRAAGGLIYFSPEIRSQYFGRQTLPALAKQYYRYGKSRVKTLTEHPQSLRARQLVAPAFVAALGGGAVLGLVSRWIQRLWLLMILTYLAANFFFSLKAAAGRDTDELKRLPVVFLTVHLAWGLGFWMGWWEVLRQRAR